MGPPRATDHDRYQFDPLTVRLPSTAQTPDRHGIEAVPHSCRRAQEPMHPLDQDSTTTSPGGSQHEPRTRQRISSNFDQCSSSAMWRVPVPRWHHAVWPDLSRVDVIWEACDPSSGTQRSGETCMPAMWCAKAVVRSCVGQRTGDAIEMSPPRSNACGLRDWWLSVRNIVASCTILSRGFWVPENWRWLIKS